MQQQPVSISSNLDHQIITTNHDLSQLVPSFLGQSIQAQQSASTQGNAAQNVAASTVLVSAYSMSPMMSAAGTPRMSFAGSMVSPNTSAPPSAAAAAAAAAAVGGGGIPLPLMSPVGMHGLPAGPRTPDGQPLLSPMGAFPGYPYQAVMPPLESPTSLLQARLQHSPGFPFPQQATMHPQQVFFPGPYDDQGTGQRVPTIDKMSWLDAAEIILEEAQQPLHLKDIKQRIVEQGLVGPNARSSLETLMYRDAQKGSKRFVKLDELLGVFRLMTPEEKKAARKTNKRAPKQATPKATSLKTTVATTVTTTTTAPTISPTATTEPTTVTSPTAAAQAERNAKFKRKSQNLRRLIKAMVFENAALCDEVARTEAKLPRARAERRFLLLRLLHYQALTGKPLLDNDQQPAVKKETNTKEKEAEKTNRKEKTEKVARKDKDRERKKDKNRHKHKKNKKGSKDGDKKLEANQLKKKKPSSSLKRHILPIPMNEEGQPIFPIAQGSLTVHSLGKVIPDKVTFHSDRFIYPAGFHSTRIYGNMDDPKKKCVYTCKIIDNGGEAKFEICDDQTPPTILSANTATKCHRKLLQAINKAFGEDIVNESRDRSQEFFGFSHPTIQNLIQGLAGATQCMAYRWLRFEECKPEEREKIAHWYESDPTVCYEALCNAYKKKMDDKQAAAIASTTTSAPPTSSASATFPTSMSSTGSMSPSASMSSATMPVTPVASPSESHNLRSLLTSAPIVSLQPSISARLDSFSGNEGK
ncbi:uncharacterized protein LOC129266127 [Lytechinus pictus]|uniref:uncharacterized protein LOC129266127 n=1 Tax=Lytechinus pictus TaxID=7653 RepID=UPI0030BA040F